MGIFIRITVSSSIVFSSIYLGISLKQAFTTVTPTFVDKPISSPDLLSKKEAAEYLNLSDVMFNLLLEKETEEKTGLTSYPTHRYIHSLDIYGQIHFSKKQLDEWIEYHLYND